ncbi:MAG: hypothetical protein HC933_04030 [Pleurocapsa sp. SU_196_0]|nr:hypothetical protein [Pleurocapsa sp. SU_196_0]
MIRSVTEMFTAMLATARTRTQTLETTPEDESLLTLSLRIPRRLKLQYDEMSNAVRVSSNSLMVNVLTAAMSAELAPTRTEATAIGARWMQVHRDHGLSLPQIAALYPDALDLAILADDTALLERLTLPLLGQTSEYFNVRREWLETGKGGVISMRNVWYKGTPELAWRIVNLCEQGFEPRIMFLKSNAGNFATDAPDRWSEDDTLTILLAVPVKVNGVEFVRHEYWGAERWTADAPQIEACGFIRFVSELPTFVSASGYTLNASDYRALSNGEIHPCQISKQLNWSGQFSPEWLYENARYKDHAREAFQLLGKALSAIKKIVPSSRRPNGLPRTQHVSS